MAQFGGGKFGSIRRSKVIKLSDTAGSDEFIIKDADGFALFKVDSKGIVKMKGARIQRIP